MMHIGLGVTETGTHGIVHIGLRITKIGTQSFPRMAHIGFGIRLGHRLGHALSQEQHTWVWENQDWNTYYLRLGHTLSQEQHTLGLG